MDGLVKAMTLSRILYTSDEANVANWATPISYVRVYAVGWCGEKEHLTMDVLSLKDHFILN